MTTIMLTLGVGGIFAGVFLSLAAFGVFTNEVRGVSKSLVVMEAFSTAPSALKQELDPSFSDRVLAPLLNRFVGIGRRLTPNDYSERMVGRLTASSRSRWSASSWASPGSACCRPFSVGVSRAP